MAMKTKKKRMALRSELDRMAMVDNLWMTNEGNVIPISKMTDGHLHNAILLMEKRFPQRKPQRYVVLMRELQRRLFLKDHLLGLHEDDDETLTRAFSFE